MMHSRLTAHNRRLPPLVLCAVCCVLCVPTSSSAYTFTRNLELGDSGEDVYALQVSLNTDVRTRIAASGPGSPGNETDFFGEKTRSAVVRYQNLHADDVLKPLGLSNGTGFVGMATRNKLTEGSGDEEGTSTASISDAIAAFDEIVENAPYNSGETDVRNEQSKELFLDMVRDNLVAEGVSERRIETIEESIEDQSEKPIEDLVDEFVEGRSRFDVATRTAEQIRSDAETIAPITQSDSVGRFAEFFRWADLKSVLLPKAHAQILQPVGGIVLYSYLCTCSYTWLILIGPPTVGLVDYETGTQGFLSYNLPYTRYLLGLSTRVPVCYVYIGYSCVPIVSTYGLLSPIVGSSAF